MNEFDEINSLKEGTEKRDKLINFYKNSVKINEWLNIENKNSIIHFKDRIEYKKNNQYHRLNGPAIDYENIDQDKYYYKGKLYDSKDEWLKITQKEVRKIKLKRLKKESPE
jgi:hypothetical protein